MDRLESERGTFICELVRNTNLCAEDANFFVDMRSVREEYRNRLDMGDADFMPHVTADLCNEGYKTSPRIWERVRNIAHDELVAHDKGIRQKTEVLEAKQMEFYSAGEGGKPERCEEKFIR